MRGGPFRLLEITTGFLLGDPPVWEAFAGRLAELGLRQPGTLTVEHVPEADLPRLAERIARVRPQAIFSGGSTQTVTALANAGDRPIVAWGSAETLAGRDVPTLCGYRMPDDHQRTCLALLRELRPGIQTIAALYDSDYPPGTPALDETRSAAARLGLRIVVYPTRSSAELDRAFASMDADRIDAIRVMNSRFLGRPEAGIVERALAARLPLMSYDWTTKDGGLLSYTPDFLRLAPLFADVVAAVARGRPPAEIGVLPCPTMALAINRSTARALGIEIPATLLARAAHVYD